MCGITGILGSYQKELIGPLMETARIQDYRGPDFFNYSFDSYFAVFHNRLSIIDTSSNSNQPYEDDDCVLVFNGEIYNYRDLAKAKLEFEFHEVHSDTIILFQLLKKYGTDIISELNGMFAFCFIDKQERRCILSRDRMGIKPLNLSIQEGAVLFSSEIKIVVRLLSLLNNYETATQINTRSLDSIFVLGSGEFQQIPFQQITEMRPGTFLVIDLKEGKKLCNEEFYSIEKTLERQRPVQLKKEIELIKQTDALLNRSIDLHMQSDVPVGTLCSGGLDSSLITAMAALRDSSVKIYHADFRGPGNERMYAEFLANKLKLDIEYVTMEPDRFLRLLPKVAWHSDLPVYHPNDISLYTVAEKAKKDGIKVLLCGEGADELFGGYSWHKYFRHASHFHNSLRKLPVFKKVSFFLNFLFLSRQFTKNELLYISGIHANYSDTNVSEIVKRNLLLRNPAFLLTIDRLKRAYEKLDSDPFLAAFITSNLYGHLGSILHRNDRICMMASIESRVPYLENDLIEFAIHLDSEFKIRKKEGKYILKKVAERYLPELIIYRKKMGFPVPYEKFLQFSNDSIFENGFLSNHFGLPSQMLLKFVKGNPMLHFHALTNELWGRIHVFNESHEELSDKIIGAKV